MDGRMDKRTPTNKKGWMAQINETASAAYYSSCFLLLALRCREEAQKKRRGGQRFLVVDGPEF